MWNLINVNCLHFIGCQNYTNVLISSTTILSNFTAAHTAVKVHVMKYSETAFISNVYYFWSIKTLPRSLKSCDCVTFRVLKYLLSTFLLFKPHCHMKLSKQTCCLWSTYVSTESQNLTSLLHLKLTWKVIYRWKRQPYFFLRTYF